MDDTRQPDPRRPARRAGLPFIPAAILLCIFALLAVWPPVIPGLPHAPRLVLLAALLAGTLGWLSNRGPSGPDPRLGRRAGRVGDRLRPGTAGVSTDAMVSSPAWLHVLSGPDPEHLTRGLLEAASALIEHGERLLLVDGARRLRFHETIRREGGPGLLECLAGELPVLEAIQGGAGEGQCFLPRGNPMRSEAWPQLGHLLRDVRTRFDRVLLALDFAVPHEAGPALEGIGAAGWWCPDGSASILSSALAERIGIPLRNIRLSMSDDVLDQTARMLSGLFPSVPASRIRTTAPPGRGPSGSVVRPRTEPQIVDCDLQVMGRLRFLVWMRGIQSEGLRELEAQHQTQS
jgi:hypothetical protein